MTPTQAREDLTLSLDELCAALRGAPIATHAKCFSGVTIDSRTARTGDVYFAIAGDRFDGHDFCHQAAQAGAAALVVARGRAPDLPVTVLEVDDTRIALGALARELRRQSSARVVGVTGSTGKTTTKGIIAAMLAGLSSQDAVLATEGSLNNETGVPLTLLGLRERHRFAVIEMGMRGLGQIDYLAGLAEPDVGVVVNAGSAHLGLLGSALAVAKGKSEIWGRLRPGGAAVHPHGDERLAELARDRAPLAPTVTFGEEPGATVRILDVRSLGPLGSEAHFEAPDPSGRRIVVTCRIPLIGRHNVDNAACALAVAVALGLDREAAAAGIATARPSHQRAEVAVIAGRNVLVDCYNANPASMRAALATLSEVKGAARGVAVLADMLELGDAEIREHEVIGGLLPTVGVDHLVAMGALGAHIAQAAWQAGVTHVLETPDPDLAARALLSWTRAGDWILIKASRGMRLERVLAALGKVVA